MQTFVKVPLTEASHLTYFISFNLYSHTWRSVLSVQLCSPGVRGSEKLDDSLGVTWLQNKSWNQALEACSFQMPPPCHTWLNPSALTHCPATHSRALGQGPHLPPLWLEATLGVDRGEGGAGPRRKIKGAPKTSISKMNTSSMQYFLKI